MKTEFLSEVTWSPPDRLLAIGKIRAVLDRDGFLFLHGSSFRELLAVQPSSDAWNAFTKSWQRLGMDEFMADRGRYRRRRHAVFSVNANAGLARQTNQPHFQSVAYNALNGGVERWFEPIEDEIVTNPVMAGILQTCVAMFVQGEPAAASWRVEVHQFRIEARVDAPGQPTPEGMHRDGVDRVLVLLIDRVNIASGTTVIRSTDDRLLKDFTLTDCLDAAILDDARVYHGVTAVEPVDPSQPAHRDVLVVTFKICP